LRQAKQQNDRALPAGGRHAGREGKGAAGAVQLHPLARAKPPMSAGGGGRGREGGGRGGGGAGGARGLRRANSGKRPPGGGGAGGGGVAQRCRPGRICIGGSGSVAVSRGGVSRVHVVGALCQKLVWQLVGKGHQRCAGEESEPIHNRATGRRAACDLAILAPILAV